MKCYLGLGTNLGNKPENLNGAVAIIAEKAGEVVAVSTVVESEPWGFDSENHFLNMVIAVETDLEPLELLHCLQNIEKEMGREQKVKKTAYQDRIIDIDILLYGDLVVDLPELKIPHPQMKMRDFVIKPLNEILGLS
jgi:2-amino-4-hydroxy-6-hydroxymethyldihydropteridine diphosphokinase